MIETGNLVKFENEIGEWETGLLVEWVKGREIRGRENLWDQFADPINGWDEREARAWVKRNPNHRLPVVMVAGEMILVSGDLEPVV